MSQVEKCSPACACLCACEQQRADVNGKAARAWAVVGWKAAMGVTCLPYCEMASARQEEE